MTPHADASLGTVRLFDEATGREIGEISEAELAFLQDALEEEGAGDRDYWIHPATIDMLAVRGAPHHLITLLRASVDGKPDGIDILYQREDEELRQLRKRGRRD